MDIVLRALRYPFQYSIALAIVVYVLFMALASMAGPFGIGLAWFTAIAAVTYTCIIFKSCANGRDKAPAVSAEDANIFGGHTNWAVFGFYVCAIGLAYRIGQIDDTLWRFVCVALWGLAFPAALALAVLNESFLDATDPARVALVIKELGLGYLGLPLAALLATLAHGLIGAAPLPGLVGDTLSGYVVFATLAYWGFALHARADDIGLEPTNDNAFRDYMTRRDESRSFDAALDAAYAESGTDSARALASLQLLFAGGNDTLEMRERVFERAREWPNEMVPLRLAQELLSRHLMLGDEQRVLALLAYGLDRNAAFRPATAAETLKVAALAQKHQKYAAVVAVLSDFGHRFADHPQRVAAAIGGAGVALGKLGDKALARKMVGEVAGLPQARRHPRFDALANALGMAASAATSGAGPQSVKEVDSRAVSTPRRPPEAT